MGTSGLLYRSNKIMYDRATNTLWASFLGEPVIGPLAYSGIKLDIFPVEMTTWGEWLDEHPDTTVLSRETGLYPPEFYENEDSRRSIYFSYRNSPETMFPVWDRDPRLSTKDEVLGLRFGDARKAYPIQVLQKERVVNDVVGDTELVIIASAVSTGNRVYAREGQVFSLLEPEAPPGGLPMSLVDSTGVEWRVTDDSLVNTSDQSQRLPRLPSHLSFWFGWYGFYPDTELYGPAGD